MAVDAATLRPTVAARVRGLRVGARVALGVAVAAATVVNLLVALQRATPRYVPDEYLYGQLARSLAHGDGVRILGEPTRFPALVEPLLTAPVWLADDPELAFRATQAIHALVMSLAAIPVYLMARRLGLRPALTAFAVLVAVLSPGFLYVGYTTADALGYTVGLAALAAGLSALARPSRASQAVFLCAAAVAAGTRVQYALVVPAVAVAGLLVARGSAWRRLRRLAIVNGFLALGAVAVPVLGGGGLGRYGAVTGFRVTHEALGWVPSSAFLLALAAGAAIVPGAVGWLAAVPRGTTLERRAFARLVAVLLAGLLVAAALMAVETTSDRFFERYLLVALPLLALSFACWLEDGRPGRWPALAAAGALLVATTRVPLSSFAAGQGAVDSPLLLAVRRLEALLGVGSASLALAVLATFSLLLAVWAVLGRERVAFAAAAATLVALGAISVGARLEDLDLSRGVARDALGTPPAWVDATGARDVLLLQTAASPGARAMDQVFWNAAVTEGALLGADAVPIDGASDRVRIGPDGTLTLAGRPLSRPLLVATSGTRPLWAHAEVAGRAPGFELVRPVGAARLAALAGGITSDGWLAGRASVTVWPGHAVALRLLLPADRPASALRVSGRRPLALAPGREVVLRLSTGARARTFELVATRSFGVSESRFVAARVTKISAANRP